MNKNLNTDLGLLIIRISIAGLMLFHGVSKLVGGIGFIEGMLAGLGLPSFLSYGVLAGEVVAPLMILVGVRTRLASLVFAINMLVAIALGHANDIFAMTPYGGWAIELPMLYLLPALALFFTGAGRYAVSTSNKWD